MISIKQTALYSEVLLEFNYSFGDVFIFDGFVVSEIFQGVHFSWNEHGKRISEDVAHYLGTDGKEIIYISNRINSYSVVALDWLIFFKNHYSLKAYYIVSDSKQGKLNLFVEELFFKNRIKNFHCILEAVDWAKKKNLEIFKP